MKRPQEKPSLEYGDTYSPGRKSLGESYMDLPRRSPPRPASVGSPGRIADLSSIRKDPGDGEQSLHSFQLLVWHFVMAISFPIKKRRAFDDNKG